jgi:hypothetical protein
VRRAGCPIRTSPARRPPAPPRSISPRGRVLRRPLAPRHPPCARHAEAHVRPSLVAACRRHQTGARQQGCHHPAPLTGRHHPDCASRSVRPDPSAPPGCAPGGSGHIRPLGQTSLLVNRVQCAWGRRHESLLACGSPTAARPRGSRVARCQGAAGTDRRTAQPPSRHSGGWSRGESNPGPPPCKGGALPAELRPPVRQRRPTQGWARLDSNQGPRPYQGRALTT